MRTHVGIFHCLGLAAMMFAVGCSAETNASPSESAFTTNAPDIEPLSLEEEGILILVNDPASTAQVLADRTMLAPSVANAIAAFRAGAGTPRWFTSMAELKPLLAGDENAFDKLLSDARAHAYVEAEGFDQPDLARLSLPDGHTGRPTFDDITVVTGFDERSPDEATALVRARITNVVHSSNERFIDTQIRRAHKSFTLAIGNFFAAGSPQAQLASSVQGGSITLLGTLTASVPTVVMVEKDGQTTYYARRTGGAYQPTSKPRYVVMRARINPTAESPGVRIFYPAWSAKVLAGPTVTVIEGS